MKSIKCIGLLLIFFLLFACKKPKPIVYSGQLLLTKKNPIPLSNRQIEIFQQGSGESGFIFIFSGSSGSSTTAATDANGRFSFSFASGTSTFWGSINDSLSFMRLHFPETNYDASKPIFVAKTIDTIIIKLKCNKNIVSSDTFALKGITTSGKFDKRFTGIIADSANTLTLDTIYNVIYTNFDCIKGIFANDNIQFGRLKTYLGGSSPYFTSQSLYWIELPAEDEPKREMTFFFND